MTDEEWKAIELAEHERTYEKSLADGQWYGGPGCAQWLVRERDALRARVAELEAERDEIVDAVIGAPQNQAVRTVVERDTAERIAAWLEQCVDDFPRNLDGRAAIHEAAEQIRDFAWRDDKDKP